MPMPNDTSLESANKKICISFFKELFTIDELKEKIRQFSPENVVIKKKSQHNRKSFFEILRIQLISDTTKLAEILYDLIGPHFLYEVQGAAGPRDDSSKKLRYEIFKKAIELDWFSLKTVNKVTSSLPYRNDQGIKDIEDIMSLRIPGPWQFKMYELLPSKFDLPLEIVEAPSKSQNTKQDIEIITAVRELLPLHDYQIFAGKKIQDLLVAQNNIRKRLLISIPTGAGKTRLVAESLIDWINDGKPSKDPNIQNSKYMIWIAQSRELCEQAISQFQEIYSQKGKSALTVFRFFGDNKMTLDTILAQRVEHGLIVCTISKIYNQIKKDERLSDFNHEYYQNVIDYDDKVHKSKIPQKYYDDFAFGRLRKMTSCVVVDEAHKAIMPTYTCVLRGLGFNFSYKDEQKCNEAGITLIGLTATAFRGTGLERSERRIIGKTFGEKVTLHIQEDEIKKYSEIDYPIICAVCKKPIEEKEVVLQSTSNKKLIWHENEQKLSAETTRIYTRFSEPLVPKIHAFTENKNPKAIITCNEKCVVNDPIRISGEKSYDLLGTLKKYSWKIERRSNLIEVFGIKTSENITLPQPKSLPSIVEEIKMSGTYKISLTVENYDGLTNTATKIIEVIQIKKTETSDEMKELIKNLITRDILCNVFHTHIKSETINVKSEKNKEIDLGGQIRKKAAENHLRNEKLINTIHYLLTEPEQTRKKILVFACDILHARSIAIWLKTKYNISAEYIDSNLHESRNISRIRKFREKSGDKGKVLINTNMLTTGFDVPDVDCVIMGRPVISTVEYTQMIGRGMRGTRMGGTKEVWIVDFDDQIQLSEHMKSQSIILGWKSMAYDQKDNLIWKSLSEKKDKDGNSLKIDISTSEYDLESEPIHVEDSRSKEKVFSVKCQSCDNISEGILEIFQSYDLSIDEKEEMNKFAKSKITPDMSALKICSECKKIDKIFPSSNDLWRKLLIKEKSNPVLLEFVNYIAQNCTESIKIDITEILDAKEIYKKIIKKNLNDSEFEQLQREIFTFDNNSIHTIQNKINETKKIITKDNLCDFFPYYIILQKNPTFPQKLAYLCKHFLNIYPLKNLIEVKTYVSTKNYTIDEKLKNEMENIIFNVLGFIPEEDKFQETISGDLYEYMIKKYTTYHNFQQQIPIAAYIQKLQKRTECLNKLASYCNKHKKNPDVATLEQLIPDFKNTVKENFANSSPNFFEMIKKIKSSVDTAKNMSFEDIKADYEYVKSLTPFAPRTEEILRHSKIGIGQYIRYAGSIPNFQDIYELTDEQIRIKLEGLKNRFSDIKKIMGGVPPENVMKEYTDYLDFLESGILFDCYAKFLEFVGESQILSYVPNESKNAIISNAKSLMKGNGMQKLFEKIAQEPELKYKIHFGSVEKFIELLFPDNKQVALSRWRDIKNKFKN